MNYEVFYNVHNGGDGSVSVSFFESSELAEFDEEKQMDDFDDGWAESSCGSLKFKGDNITPAEIGVQGIITKEFYFIEYFAREWDATDEKCQKFLDKFFDGYFPKCTVDVEPVKNDDYAYYLIYLPDGKLAAKIFTKADSDILEKINRWSK